MQVLVLTSSTGGGHDMRARAFQTWAQRDRRLDLDAHLHWPLSSSHGLYRFGVKLYNWIQRTAPVLHHGYFNFLETVPLLHVETPLGAHRYRSVLEQVQPDVLLSVHDQLNHGFFEYARDVLGRDRVRCVTYCGELHDGYGFSRHWVNPAADLFVGAVPETCEAAIQRGMPPEKTQAGGFLLHPSFFDPRLDEASQREYVHEQLQLNPDEFILLLTASSRGANNHLRFLEALHRDHPGIQVVVLCGRSELTRQRIEHWARDHRTQRVRVLPHDTDIGRLMQCVSAVVTRPGTGTTSEAILSQCPLLFNCLGGLMPQELITVKFCRKNGLSEMIRRPQDLSRLVRQWAGNPEPLQAMRQRMKAVRPTGHPLEILQSVAAVAAAPFTTDSTVAAPIPVVETARAELQTVPASFEMLRPQ